jgi:anti-sigma B factor antagonist
MNLEYKLDEADHMPVIRLAGRFDAEAAAFVKSQIHNLATDLQPNLMIDLHNVHFIDSLGLAALVSGLKICRKQGGALKLVGLQANVRQLFELTRLDHAFEIYPSLENALASFKPNRSQE